MEVVGVHAGVPFGRYAYTETLGLQLMGVPVVLACAWLLLAAYVTDRLRRLLLPASARVALGALWLVAVDLLIDPLAASALNYWRWCEDGRYYGVPLSNFGGWFVTGALLVALLSRNGADLGRTAAWTGLSTIVFFGVVAAIYGLTAPVLVSLVLVLAHFAVQRRVA
jgi:putative membrane protein